MVTICFYNMIIIISGKNLTAMCDNDIMIDKKYI